MKNSYMLICIFSIFGLQLLSGSSSANIHNNDEQNGIRSSTEIALAGYSDQEVEAQPEDAAIGARPVLTNLSAQPISESWISSIIDDMLAGQTYEQSIRIVRLTNMIEDLKDLNIIKNNPKQTKSMINKLNKKLAKEKKIEDRIDRIEKRYQSSKREKRRERFKPITEALGNEYLY